MRQRARARAAAARDRDRSEALMPDRDLRAGGTWDLCGPNQTSRSFRKEARDRAAALKGRAMLESILQGLREVEGVQGAMIVDSGAAVVAHRAHSIYDLGVLQQVARSVVNSIDSVQLIQDDWDMLTAHFGDGKLLLRSLRTGGGKPRRYILTVIADASLNTAFLGVALRVAASKLLVELESSAGPAPGS